MASENLKAVSTLTVTVKVRWWVQSCLRCLAVCASVVAPLLSEKQINWIAETTAHLIARFGVTVRAV